MKIKINGIEIVKDIPEKNAEIEFELEDGNTLSMDIEKFLDFFDYEIILR